MKFILLLLSSMALYQLGNYTCNYFNFNPFIYGYMYGGFSFAVLCFIDWLFADDLIRRGK